MLDLTELEEAVGGNRTHETHEEDVIARLRDDDALNIPIEMTDFEMWENYMNEDLYFLDKKLREYFKKTKSVRSRNQGMKTALPLVFAWIYGRQPTSQDSAVSKMLHRLLEYYCTRYTGKSKIAGRSFTRVYYFSKYATEAKRPYSLKLRVEEANAKGQGRPFVPYGTNRDKGPKRSANKS